MLLGVKGSLGILHSTRGTQPVLYTTENISARRIPRLYMHLRKKRKRFIMRWLRQCLNTATSRIEIWSVDLADKLSAGVLVQNWELEPLWRERRGEEIVPGEYVIAAKSLGSSSGTRRLYTFRFKGVSILSWQYVEFESGVLGNEGGDKFTSRVVYER